MILVVIESPYAGDVERNLRYLRAAMHDCLQRGESPYASHALLTQPGVLDDSIPAQRELGIMAGFAWRDVATKTVVYTDLGITPGMAAGIEHAERMDREIEYRRLGAVVTRSTVAQGELNVDSMPSAGRERGISSALAAADSAAKPPKIGGLLRAKPRAKKPRTWERLIYSGALLLTDGIGVLQMKRGAFVRRTNAEGEIVSDVRDERAGLLVNIGDKVIVCGQAIESNAMLVVTRIEPDWAERLSVRLLCGVAENGNVHVMNAKGLAK